MREYLVSYMNHWTVMHYTVKPLNNGHRWEHEKVAVLQRLPLFRGSTF